LNYLTTCCPIPAQPDVIQLHDLQTGTTVQPPQPPAGRRQAVTSGGTALLLNQQTGSLTLWTPQSSRGVSTGRVGERASTEMPAHSPLVEPDMRISRHPALLKTLA
jgi:hypothetical protein